MDDAGTLATAIDLMQRALDLLDQTEELHAACHLQYAVDILQRDPPARHD